MNAHDDAGAIHDKVFMLLPWRINDTLSSAETTLVDTHIQNCPICRQEASLLQATFRASLAVSVTTPDVHNSLAQCLHRIESEPLSNSLRRPSLIDYLNNRLGGLQRRFNRAPVNRMTVAATGIAVLFIALISLQQRPSVLNDDYRVLSSPTVADEPTLLSIDFTTELSPADAKAVLQDAAPDLLSSAELQYVVDKQYVLTLPATSSIQQISKLIRDLQNQTAIARVDMRTPY